MIDDQFKLFYGQYILKHRKAMGLSQEEAAYRIGFSKDSLSRIERGITMPKFPTSLAIEKTLNLDHNRIQTEYQKYCIDPDMTID